VPRPPSPQLTEVEVQILGVLWALGPCTVRQVHQELSGLKDTNYSTTVKMLSVMLDKGLVKRDDSARPMVYRAAMSRERAQKNMLGDLIRRLYGGSTMSLVMQALSSRQTSPEELNRLRQFLDEQQRGGATGDSS
jgi:BlaI family transcriptional regulator, penicillinase repressor